MIIKDKGEIIYIGKRDYGVGSGKNDGLYSSFRVGGGLIQLTIGDDINELIILNGLSICLWAWVISEKWFEDSE